MPLTNDQLKSLKVGDSVFVITHRLSGLPYATRKEVTRVSRTIVTVGSSRFRIKNGSLIGEDVANRTELELPDSPEVLRIKTLYRIARYKRCIKEALDKCEDASLLVEVAAKLSAL